MEWGKNGAAFIAEMEWTVFTSGKNLLENLFHPVIFPCLLGQLLLLYSAIAKEPNRWINSVAVILLAGIVLLFLLIGIMSVNWKVIIAAIPFILLSVYFFFVKPGKSKQ